MRLTRRRLLGLLGLGAAASALPPAASVAAAPVDPVAEAVRAAQSGSNAMTAITGTKHITVPENLLEMYSALGRLRGRNEMRADMERVAEIRGENVGITPEWRQSLGNTTVSSNVHPLHNLVNGYIEPPTIGFYGPTFRRINPGDAVDSAELQQIVDGLQGRYPMKVRWS